MLPYVKINFANGAIGGVAAMDDGVTMMILDGTSADIVCQNYTDYLNKIGDAEPSPEVEAFYNEVGGNAKLIITDCNITDADLKKKIGEYHGEVRCVVVADIAAADSLSVLQNVGKWSAESLFAPVLFLVGVKETIITAQTAGFSALNKDRIAVVDTVVDSNSVPLLYYVAGRLARIPVQRSLARVKDGALFPSVFKDSKGTVVDNIYAEARHGKGLITARTYVGKAGYYISDDLMAAEASSDYALVPRRRVIDKAYRIAYATLVNYIGDEIPVTDSGQIPATTCKDIENTVSRQIELLMTNEGNLGVDPNDTRDTGVTCYIDPSQPVVATSKLNVSLKVKPYGYAKYIDVNLGFVAVG